MVSCGSVADPNHRNLTERGSSNQVSSVTRHPRWRALCQGLASLWALAGKMRASLPRAGGSMSAWSLTPEVAWGAMALFPGPPHWLPPAPPLLTHSHLHTCGASAPALWLPFSSSLLPPPLPCDLSLNTTSSKEPFFPLLLSFGPPPPRVFPEHDSPGSL